MDLRTAIPMARPARGSPSAAPQADQGALVPRRFLRGRPPGRRSLRWPLLALIALGFGLLTATTLLGDNGIATHRRLVRDRVAATAEVERLRAQRRELQITDRRAEHRSRGAGTDRPREIRHETARRRGHRTDRRGKAHRRHDRHPRAGRAGRADRPGPRAAPARPRAGVSGPPRRRNRSKPAGDHAPPAGADPARRRSRGGRCRSP